MLFAARCVRMPKRLFLFMAFGLRACLPEAGAAEIIISTATTSTVTLGAADSLTVTGSGSIAVNNGSNAVSVGTGVDRITNSGTIFGTNGSSAGYGIILQNDSTIANGITNTGIITGYVSAIGVTNRASSTNNVVISGGITNSGTLQINVPTNNVVPSTIMLAGATLHGGISNSGFISATGGSDRYSALWTDSGAIINGGLLNSGTMNSQVNAGITINPSTFNDGITNTATGLIQSGASSGLRIINGGTLNGGLDNAGTIRGASGITLNSTSRLAGGVLNRAGGLIEASAAAGVGISVTVSSTISGTIQNQGSIAGGTGATGDGVLVQSGATLGGLINSGTISSGRNALNLQNTANPFVVTNTGTMTGNVALGINTLQGTGRVVGSISGAGSVNPGSSPGILTASSVDPTGGLDFNFEFTGNEPNYTSGTASINDVLRLTAATPFSTAMSGSNTVSVYFDQPSMAAGSVFRGGFFTDTASEFDASIAGATYVYYIRGDGNGTAATYNGQSYYLLQNLLSGLTIDRSTTAATADFGGGSPVSGYVLTFSAVPEPSTYAMAIAGLAGGGFSMWRRRKGA